MKPPVRYCAVYTRKSSEEGLDQDFNSLDAQRESCLAYIASQKAEGWAAIKEQYDDGGFSGGNTERPALKKLLDDIRTGKVHIIVVYKIDRLTRSLMDFAKLVEVFDQHQVTFVSITQSFNTTTSMGRLTLNVLLSFAQFEREVTGERIRDKIAASKRKGMWMGGIPPIGYDLKDRQLIINEKYACITRHIFERYLVLGCVSSLREELKINGYKSAIRVSMKGNTTGGCDFSRGILYKILSNPVYIGRIRHKGVTYDGQHEAIISQDLWDRVQQKLSWQTATSKGTRKAKEISILKGLLYDCEGTIYSPSHTNKKGKRYRYYVSQNLLQYRDHPKGVIARIPAHEIETVVENGVRKYLQEEDSVKQLLNLEADRDHAIISHIVGNEGDIKTAGIIAIIRRISVDTDTLTITLNVPALRQLVTSQLKLKLPDYDGSESCRIKVSYEVRKSYLGTVVIEPKSGDGDIFNNLHPNELKNLVRGVIWRDEHLQGMSLREIADREGLPENWIGTLIRQSFQTLRA